MAHYIVVTDIHHPGDAIASVSLYLDSLEEKYPDMKFKMTGAMNKYTKEWFSPTNEDGVEFSESTVMGMSAEIMSASPFGTTEDDVIRALESRSRQDLKAAYQHLHWMYVTASVNDDNFNIWIDSLFDGEIHEPGITNITTEYESDPETTYMVAVEVA